MASITVNGNTVNPVTEDIFPSDATESNFILLQGHNPLTVEQKDQAKRLGVNIQEYVAENTYLCRYLPHDLEQLRRLPFVNTANVYLPEMKTTISLKNMVQTEANRQEYEVDLILHAVPNVTSTELAPFIAEAAGVPESALQVIPNKIRLTVHQDKLERLAALDSVNRIEEVREKTTYNDRARRVLHVDDLDVEYHQSVAPSDYTGKGQIVCVADSGIDLGAPPGFQDADLHHAFAGRIKCVLDLVDNDYGRDHTGHGTHVCASVCGNGKYTDPDTRKEITVRGTAPGAQLMVQSMSKWNGDAAMWKMSVPLDFRSVFEVPYSQGVRIHSNSWGDAWDAKQLGYEDDASTIDKFISEHQDFTIVIAAGNDNGRYGCGTSQIGDNSAAKNCITVGATGSTRDNNGTRIFKGFKQGTNPTQTALFSSRGPTLATKDANGRVVVGRIKPDVVAPGVVVLSAASRAQTKPNEIDTLKRYGDTGDKGWLYMSGTSMATPLVSGCVALIREALGRRGKYNPSAALIKALLVNGAVNFSTKGAVFDYQQGFGRVDVQRSILMVEGKTATCGFVDGGNRLESTVFDVPTLRMRQAAERRWESAAIAVPRGSNKVVVTLAYPDPAGALLQRDLNLIVRAGGDERHGNMGTGEGFDATNNVEKVIWDNVSSETITINVVATGFAEPDPDEQSFAVAWDLRSE